MALLPRPTLSLRTDPSVHLPQLHIQVGQIQRGCSLTHMRPPGSGWPFGADFLSTSCGHVLTWEQAKPLPVFTSTRGEPLAPFPRNLKALNGPLAISEDQLPGVPLSPA